MTILAKQRASENFSSWTPLPDHCVNFEGTFSGKKHLLMRGLDIAAQDVSHGVSERPKTFIV